MNKYFENASTLEVLRKQYKELLKLHHPDNGGDLVDVMIISMLKLNLYRLDKLADTCKYQCKNGINQIVEVKRRASSYIIAYVPECRYF